MSKVDFPAAPTPFNSIPCPIIDKAHDLPDNLPGITVN